MTANSNNFQMDFDNITPRMKNGILLLDYFADPEEFYKVSNSVDLALWQTMKKNPVSTTRSKISKQSSYSGSRYDRGFLNNNDSHDHSHSEVTRTAKGITKNVQRKNRQRSPSSKLKSDRSQGTRKFSAFVNLQEPQNLIEKKPVANKVSCMAVSKNFTLGVEGQEIQKTDTSKEMMSASHASMSNISEVPNIQVTEDKTEFSVVRHLKGLPQAKEYKPVLSKQEHTKAKPKNFTILQSEKKRNTPLLTKERNSILNCKRSLHKRIENLESREFVPVIK